MKLRNCEPRDGSYSFGLPSSRPYRVTTPLPFVRQPRERTRTWKEGERDWNKEGGGSAVREPLKACEAKQ